MYFSREVILSHSSKSLKTFPVLLSLFPGRVAQLLKYKRVICVFLLNLLTLSSFLKVIVISTSAISGHEATLLTSWVLISHSWGCSLQRPKEWRNSWSSSTVRSHHSCSQCAPRQGRVSGVQPSTLTGTHTFGLTDNLTDPSLGTNKSHHVTVSGLHLRSFRNRRYKNLAWWKDMRNIRTQSYRQKATLKSTRNEKANPFPLGYWFRYSHRHDPSL